METYEVTFYYYDDFKKTTHESIFEFDATCGTEALNIAIDAMKTSGAEHFNVSRKNV